MKKNEKSKIGTLIMMIGIPGSGKSTYAKKVIESNPTWGYVSRDEVPSTEIEEESKALKEQAINEGKPEEIAEKMVQGRINKYYKDVVIVEQEFVKNPDVTIGTYLKNNSCTLKQMIRYEVGEGIEKKEENFAEEVMAQING